MTTVWDETLFARVRIGPVFSGIRTSPVLCGRGFYRHRSGETSFVELDLFPVESFGTGMRKTGMTWQGKENHEEVMLRSVNGTAVVVAAPALLVGTVSCPVLAVNGPLVPGYNCAPVTPKWWAIPRLSIIRAQKRRQIRPSRRAIRGSPPSRRALLTRRPPALSTPNRLGRGPYGSRLFLLPLLSRAREIGAS